MINRGLDKRSAIHPYAEEAPKTVSAALEDSINTWLGINTEPPGNSTEHPAGSPSSWTQHRPLSSVSTHTKKLQKNFENFTFILPGLTFNDSNYKSIHIQFIFKPKFNSIAMLTSKRTH